MNYWEMRKSFWTTRNGVMLMMAIALVIMAGSVFIVNVILSPFPIIEEFDAEPEFIAPGETAILSWKTVGADRVEISPGIGAVDLEGFAEVRPEETTVYMLNATNGSVLHSTDVQITVAET